MTPRRLAVAADHNGVALKALVVERLSAAGHRLTDHGVDTAAGEVHYPPLCGAVCDDILASRADGGIIIGGSGSGESIACNRRPGIRAGIAWSGWATEISRGNNDANVMIIPAKALDDAEALELVEVWLSTPFKGGVHAERLAQIEEYDAGR
ncbi:RpiB/LacA/LacB family sugar-phosphate isomerase [Nocardioides sp. NPDC058538]|uniref:RpiB/LacA/LacB family sugar-phosphate isomerase n=1 Tax=Nocardioides sp. NPDC058538 TaxID=3346542 RepID=UPI00365B87D1